MRLRVAKKIWSRRTGGRYRSGRRMDLALGLMARAHRRGSRLVSWPKYRTPQVGERPTMYVIESGRPVPAPDVISGAIFIERASNRIVRLGGLVISTVFLGVDHAHFTGGPPVLWETMVFAAEGMPNAEEIDLSQRRYRSRLEAVAGHEEVVAEAREFLGRRPAA